MQDSSWCLLFEVLVGPPNDSSSFFCVEEGLEKLLEVLPHQPVDLEEGPNEVNQGLWLF